MLLSRRIEKGLNWIERSEKSIRGGLSVRFVDNAWIGPYPEVTGYTIPTLYNFGQVEIANRLADWLVTMQKADGGFGGSNMDGDEGAVSIVFDTCAVLEGLKAAEVVDPGRYKSVIDDIYKYLYQDRLRNKGGAFAVSMIDHRIQAYDVLSLAKAGMASKFWRERMELLRWPWIDADYRTHYIAYALEGAQMMGWKIDHILDIFRDMDRPFAWSYDKNYKPLMQHTDISGNLQMSILLKDKELFDEITEFQTGNGGFPVSPDMEQIGEISWALKYWLDGITLFYPDELERFTDG